MLSDMTDEQKIMLPAVYKIISDAEILLTKLLGNRVDLFIKLNKNEVEYEELQHISLQQLVCREYGIDWGELVSKKRHTRIILARTAYCYLARRVLGHTYSRIGKMVNRDHTSIMNLVRKAQGFIDVNDLPAQKILKIKTELYENFDQA